MTMSQYDAMNHAENPYAPFALPETAKFDDGLVQVKNGRLWYRDTGGAGETVVLLHAAAGSGLLWGYQLPALARAGYRAIAYSRRGYVGSSALDEKDPGSAVDDLQALVDALGVGRFHLVGVAAGGWVAADYALSYAEQLLSLTVAGNPLGQTAGHIADLQRRIRPSAWDALPAWFRELSGSYCAACPEGLQKWIELNAISLVDPEHHRDLHRTVQPARHRIGPDDVAGLKMPVLLMGGEADVYSPPAIIRMTAELAPNCDCLIATGAGHSVYWERPALFNRVLIDFLARQTGRAGN